MTTSTEHPESIADALSNYSPAQTAQMEYERLHMLVRYAEQNEDETKKLQAHAAIMGSVASAQVRTGWTNLGKPLRAKGFSLVLRTDTNSGARIRGTLTTAGVPHKAWFEYQSSLGTWLLYTFTDEATLLQFASHFYVQHNCSENEND